MANDNTPPKDLEVRLTELENSVQALTQAMQGPQTGTATFTPQICVACSVCYQCYHCYHCYICRPICNICRPICAECNGCTPTPF